MVALTNLNSPIFPVLCWILCLLVRLSRRLSRNEPVRWGLYVVWHQRSRRKDLTYGEIAKYWAIIQITQLALRSFHFQSHFFKINQSRSVFNRQKWTFAGSLLDGVWSLISDTAQEWRLHTLSTCSRLPADRLAVVSWLTVVAIVPSIFTEMCHTWYCTLLWQSLPDWQCIFARRTRPAVKPAKAPTHMAACPFHLRLD